GLATPEPVLLTDAALKVLPEPQPEAAGAG
ncbi:MAG: hypothetical protein UZ15_CFX003002169, partial [Chloroflexi bacterium OLB15]